MLTFKYRFDHGNYCNVVNDKQVSIGIVSKAEIVNFASFNFTAFLIQMVTINHCEVETDSITVLFPRLSILLQRFHIYY